MRLAARLGALALVLLASGCTYTVDVYNASGSSVLVRMVQLDPIQPDWVLDSERVQPGSRVRLGPARVAFESVAVDAGTSSRQTTPARLRIKPGTTSLLVESGSAAEGSPFVIREGRPK
ncbi:MAG: hypothetical protein JNM80_06290 [Phycisphaerae bacterium]|nr:hypothetical protein [Phycisphaerae bacterium]